MTIWATADLHLSFGTPGKEMDIFGDQWKNHAKKIADHWKAQVSDEDLVLIAGDISWAKRAEQVRPDLEWIDALPGTKLMVRGNHDYWWESVSKVKKVLPPSVHIIQNNAFTWNDVSIGGTRLWDTEEFSFLDYLDITEQDAKGLIPQTEHQRLEWEKIFIRELGRLELSLKAMDPSAKQRIVMTHYPPIGAKLQSTRASKLLEKYNVDICLFGHLHNVMQDMQMFGKKNGIQYLLVSCDYRNFELSRISHRFSEKAE